MFGKLKLKIKDKLIKFLEIDTIKRKFEHHESSNNTQYELLTTWINSTYKDLKNEISHFQNSVNVLHDTVENVVHIGTDVKRPEYEKYDGHSWAVVCIEGKMNLVKFVDLGTSDARRVLDFLKQYEAGRHCIDTPNSQMFYLNMFKF
jgi:FtsZ-interacting cell division protein YlmF